MSAKLLKSSTTNKREIARMTTRDDVIPMKRVETGRIIKVGGWVMQEITNEQTGETFSTVLVQDADSGEIYGTRSDAFMRRFFEILEICADDDSEDAICIQITRGTGKSGNEFVSCSLV